MFGATSEVEGVNGQSGKVCVCVIGKRLTVADDDHPLGENVNQRTELLSITDCGSVPHRSSNCDSTEAHGVIEADLARIESTHHSHQSRTDTVEGVLEALFLLLLLRQCRHLEFGFDRKQGSSFSRSWEGKNSKLTLWRTARTRPSRFA